MVHAGCGLTKPTLLGTKFQKLQVINILYVMQLFLLKRGGEEIYVGPLGRHSSHLIKYFEVSMINIEK